MFTALRNLVGVEGKALNTGGYSPGGGSFGESPTGGWGSGGWRRSRGGDRAAGWDMDAVIAEGYERSVWAFRCVELISGSQSRLPFKVALDYDTDEQRILDKHPLYTVLNRRANPLETGRVFRKRLSAQILLSKKGAFVEVTKNRGGQISRLDLLNPDGVEIVLSNSGTYVDHFLYTAPDGTVRELAPQRVRWIREPHPTDQFCGVTPLEAAGISIELDMLSRLYNVQFIKNDSRPGGILAVDTTRLADQEVERIQRRFAPGAAMAGVLSVIASGAGGARYIDTTTRPRDMAYGDASQNARVEILSAFGVGESLLGNAAGRTWDNAEQEEWNFWTGTMPPHIDLIASAFADDVDEDLTPFLDTSRVEALEIGKRRERQEARTEVNEGLRAVDEYRPLAGLRPLDTAQSRAVWINTNRGAIPGRPEDRAELLGPEGAGAPLTDAPPGQGAPTEQVTAADVVEDEEAAIVDGGMASAVVADLTRERPTVRTGPGTAEAVVDDLVNDRTGTRPRDTSATGVVAGMETKAVNPSPVTGPGVEHTVSQETSSKAEVALAAALTAILARQRGVVAARLESPKTRKGTRFWKAQDDLPVDSRAGQEPIDAARVVDAERWVEEITTTTSPIVTDAAQVAAVAFLLALAGAGQLALSGAGQVAQATPEAIAEAAEVVVSPVTTAAQVAIAAAVLRFLLGLTEEVDAAQLAANDVTDLISVTDRYFAEHAPRLAEGLAGDVATLVTNGATEAAAAAVKPKVKTVAIVREWVTRRDDRVRPTHRAVDGKTLPVGERFDVGGESALYPQDPTLSAKERWGCRCRCRYSTARGARFTL